MCTRRGGAVAVADRDRGRCNARHGARAQRPQRFSTAMRASLTHPSSPPHACSHRRTIADVVRTAPAAYGGAYHLPTYIPPHRRSTLSLPRSHETFSRAALPGYSLTARSRPPAACQVPAATLPLPGSDAHSGASREARGRRRPSAPRGRGHTPILGCPTPKADARHSDRRRGVERGCRAAITDSLIHCTPRWRRTLHFLLATLVVRLHSAQCRRRKYYTCIPSPGADRRARTLWPTTRRVGRVASSALHRARAQGLPPARPDFHIGPPLLAPVCGPASPGPWA